MEIKKSEIIIEVRVSKDQDIEYLFQELERQFEACKLHFRHLVKVGETYRANQPFCLNGKPIENNGFRLHSSQTIASHPHNEFRDYCKNCEAPFLQRHAPKYQ